MEPEGSLPHSQVPTNCPFPELFSELSFFGHSQLKSEKTERLYNCERKNLWEKGIVDSKSEGDNIKNAAV